MSGFKDRKLAARAGRKGGLSGRPETRTFSTNRELAREAGRKGGKAPRKSRLDRCIALTPEELERMTKEESKT